MIDSMPTFRVEPKVSGELGPDAVLNTSTWPPVVEYFQFAFDAWRGEDIVETFPTFLVTDRLRRALQSASITGLVFGHVDACKGEQFDILMRGADVDLGQWHRMDVVGRPDADDAWLVANHLTVNERLMALLSSFDLNGSIITESPGGG